MKDEELKNRINAMKERMLASFLRDLDNIAFVKSTNSVTMEEEDLDPVIQDLEGIIIISGEFDREDLKNLLVSRAG